MPCGSLIKRIEEGTTTVHDAREVAILTFLVERPISALFVVLIGGIILGAALMAVFG